MRKLKGKWTFTTMELMDCNTSLAPVIIDALEQFIEYHKDHPFGGCPNGYLPRGVDHTDEQINKGIALFHEDIKMAIYAFKNEEPEYEGTFGDDMSVDEVLWAEYCRKMDEHNTLVSEGMAAFVRIWPHLWI